MSSKKTYLFITLAIALLAIIIALVVTITIVTSNKKDSSNEVVVNNKVENTITESTEENNDTTEDIIQPRVKPEDIKIDSVTIPEVVEDSTAEEHSEVYYSFPTPEEFLETTAFEYYYNPPDFGIPMKVIPGEKEIFDDMFIRYSFSIENTDLIFYVEYNTADDDGNTDYVFSEVANKYGTDYSTVYFNNGVPVNSLEIYEELNEVTFISTFTTDYVDGTTCSLTDVYSGEVTVITLD